jgi:flagellar protein FlaF
MGFSVSGSAAIIFVAAFIGFGMFYSSAANTTERITDAKQDREDRVLKQENTAIDLTDLTYNQTANSANLTIINTGSTALSVEETDVLLDNEYQTGYRTAVDGNEGTDVWSPEQTLVVNVTETPSQPNRAKVITGPGIAATGVF